MGVGKTSARLLMWLRLGLALLLVGTMAPLGMGVSAASQNGDDHKVTICHRTNAENNPYVVITVDKASLFKRGHDTHDEGGVYQPGDKARGVRWGDIIPAFDYFASPKDQRDGIVSHYDGLNIAEGQSILDDGCEVPDENPPEPAGNIDGECLEDGSFVVSGSLDADGAEDAEFRLELSTGGTIALSGSSFDKTISAAPGTKVELQVKVGEDDWTTLDSVTVKECEQPQEDETGKLKIRKVLDGDPLGTDPTFTVHVDCPGTAYDQDVVLNQANGYVNVTGDIPTGTECTLTETDLPDGWDIDEFQPGGQESVTVTVGKGTPETVSATVENDRRTGRVQITKVVKGEAAPGTEFTVHLDCPGEDYDEVAVLNAGNEWTSPLYVGIPSGIECTVTEPNVPAGWSLDSITWTIDEDNQSGTTGTFRIDSFATVEVTVTNSRPTAPPPPTTGVISVTKQLTGPVGDASTSFTFDVDCPETAYDQSLVVAVTNGSSATGTTTQIPTGLTCTVTERSTPGWSQTSVVPAGGVVAVGSTVTFTNARVTPPPPTGSVTKTSVPATGTVVAPGQKIDYTVTVKNTGQAAITGAPVVDTLPSHVTVVPGTVSDGGTTSADGRSITWTVTLAPGATKSLTYQGLVAAGAPANASLVNKATFLLQESTTTHTVGSRGLSVVKAVSPTGAAKFGDTLTYALTVSATGNLPQSNVVVTDPVPAGTTYVPSSAGCDAGTCTVAVTGGVVSWSLGTMAAGTSRTVSFQVTIDTPARDSDGAIPAVDIVNAGAAASNEVPTTPSNEVTTPVTAVERVKEGPKGPGAETPDEEVPAGPTDTGVLPRTGAGISSGMVGGIAGILLLMGIALMVVARPAGIRPER